MMILPFMVLNTCKLSLFSLAHHNRLLFQCRYLGTGVEALVMEVNSLPPPVPVAAAGPLRVELRLANGECFSKGCVEGEWHHKLRLIPVNESVLILKLSSSDPRGGSVQLFLHPSRLSHH